jgi:hypothetical protein
VHSEEALDAVLGLTDGVGDPILGLIDGAGDAELVGASVARGGLDMHVVRELQEN